VSGPRYPQIIFWRGCYWPWRWRFRYVRRSRYGPFGELVLGFVSIVWYSDAEGSR
jgi:hypothetical protein